MNACLLEWINHSEERKKFSSERLACVLYREFTRWTNWCVLQRMSIFICIIKTTWKERELEFEGRQKHIELLIQMEKKRRLEMDVSVENYFKFVCFSTRIQWNGRELHCVCHFNKIRQPKTMKMHRITREKFNELNLIYFSGKRTPARVPRFELIAECKTHQISIFVACAVVEI